MGQVLLKYAGKKEEFARLAGLRDYTIGRNTDNDVVVSLFIQRFLELTVLLELLLIL